MAAQAQRDRQLAAYTVEYCQGDKKQAAALLGVSPALLEIVLCEENPDKLLPSKLSAKMQINYTKNVSFSDPLTGLVNKTHFMSLLRDSLERGEAGAVFFLDLNKFKPINDTYGHEAGDIVLKTVAGRLENQVKKQGVDGGVVARLGGDEFAVLLPQVGPESSVAIQRGFQGRISEEICLDGAEQTVRVGVSVGVAHYPADGKTAEKLLHKADEAMYAQKGSRG